MLARTALLPLALLLGATALRQQDTKVTEFGADRFVTGATVVVDEVGVDDLFVAGGEVRVESDLTGSVHVAGRRVEVVGAVGGDAYAAGMDVRVTGRVEGDATLAGSEVRVGEVAGDLRVAAGTVILEGPVAGSALLTGGDVRIEGPILGDVKLTGGTLRFLEGARIDGRVILLERVPGTHFVPPSVAPQERVERRRIEEAADSFDPESSGWEQVLVRLLKQVAVIGVLATFAAEAATRLAPDVARIVLGQPRRVLSRGFRVEALIAGSGIVLAVIGIALVSSVPLGLLFVPLSLLASWFVGGVGYVVGVYALGVGLLKSFGQSAPEGFGPRALAAVLGALVARSLALVPLVGWVALLGLSLAGVGAVALGWRRPEPGPASAT